MLCENSIKDTTQMPTTTTTITTKVTSIANVVSCPSGLNICQNGGICLIVDNTQVVCICPVGFTGSLNQIDQLIIF